MCINEIRKYMHYIHRNKLLKEFCEFCSKMSIKDTNELMKLFYEQKMKEVVYDD